ncbi:GH116 family glycosyl-hydrolase [Paenibacillus solisilvae]|uniref:GH116 family glycosyl-hydrolase n=1 Tax=Paenibacillus solisilvae TaxID=2486751 RepID=A0ABW0VUQ1_9BACL
MKKVYKGPKTKEISFPLGGIGSGSIGLAGNGRLIDWEIFNRPNKKSFNGFSHFAIKAEREGEVLDCRVLNGDLQAPYVGEHVRGGPLHSGYGFGPESQTMAGMPHFQEVEFIGEYPLANLTMADPCFPGLISLLAFNPLIPLNDTESSIPAAFFEWEIENITDQTIAYTINLAVQNQMPSDRIIHAYNCREVSKDKKLHLLSLTSNQFNSDHLQYGDISIATDAAEASYQEFWYRGGWCDNLEMYWHDFTKAGRVQNRHYGVEEAPHPRHKDTGSLAAHVEVAPKDKQKVRFLISWNYPNMNNYWNPAKSGSHAWTNYYSSLFEDSEASAIYSMTHWDRLYMETLRFKEALFSSTLPEVVKEAVSANLSVLKSATCLRLTDGSFYGFEGCIEDKGCCEGSCTHVWNYAYALPFLFPKLERSMRDLDFQYNRREDGRMSFRLMLPVGRERPDFHACADGQFGGVIKAYRDWKISGDTKWLLSNWQAIKQSIEYAWADSNEDKWDPKKKGVLEGRQHHTLDMELYGPNSWLSGFYLAALKAGAEIAAYLGEHETAEMYDRIFQSGKQWVDRELFNGEYYSQQLDLSSYGAIERFGVEAVDGYWNKETGQIKYQIAEGCVIDQVVAQWHANLCGLGEIFDKEQTRQALKSLYQNNFKANMRNEANTWRLFSLNDEGGLVICTWPQGSVKPAIPLTYNSETMTGFEYQAAAHMIQEGLIEEGLSIVTAIRDRYDGEKRNPWNEIECGSNYARSMASYSLLHAYSGFEYNLTERLVGFHPVPYTGSVFRTLWSLDSGWGTFEIGDDEVNIKVLGGKLNLGVLRLSSEVIAKISHIRLDKHAVHYQIAENAIHLLPDVVIDCQHPLIVELTI